MVNSAMPSPCSFGSTNETLNPERDSPLRQAEIVKGPFARFRDQVLDYSMRGLAATARFVVVNPLSQRVLSMGLVVAFFGALSDAGRRVFPLLPSELQQRLMPEQSEFVPAEQSEFVPAEESEFVPAEESEFVPAEESEFVPAEESEFVPAEESEFVPQGFEEQSLEWWDDLSGAITSFEQYARSVIQNSTDSLNESLSELNESLSELNESLSELNESKAGQAVDIRLLNDILDKIGNLKAIDATVDNIESFRKLDRAVVTLLNGSMSYHGVEPSDGPGLIATSTPTRQRGRILPDPADESGEIVVPKKPRVRFE